MTTGHRFSLVRRLARDLQRHPNVDRWVRPPLRWAWRRVWDVVAAIETRAAGSPIVELDLDVGRLAVDMRDVGVARPLRQYGSYEDAERAVLRAVIEPGAHVLDVGANIGYHTLLMAQLVGVSGRVVAIEPDPANLALLRRNVEANGLAQVNVVGCAVGATEGSAALVLDAANRGAHHVATSGDVTVPIRPLDAIVADQGLRPSVVKIDIEGGEVGALRGAPGLLAGGDDLVMVVEMNPAALARGGASADDLWQMLEDGGFRVHDIMPDGGLRPLSGPPTDRRPNRNLVAVRGEAPRRRLHAQLEARQ